MRKEIIAKVALSEATRRLTGEDASSWSGALHVHHPGKTGELLTFFGFLPEIRRQLPLATLHLHTLRHYGILTAAFENEFDIVSCQEHSSSLVRSASEAFAYVEGVSNAAGFLLLEDGIHVNPYRTHYWYKSGIVSSGSYFRAYAEAVGVDFLSWKKPQCFLPKTEPVALALVSANTHSATRRLLPFTANQWTELSKLAKSKKLRPIATGHFEDPKPESMPGWEWIDCDLLQAVKYMVSAKWVVGHNSGMVWAPCFLGSASVIMLDGSPQAGHSRLYLLDRTVPFVDHQRCKAIQTPPDGAKDFEAFELARRSLRDLDS